MIFFVNYLLFFVINSIKCSKRNRDMNTDLFNIYSFRQIKWSKGKESEDEYGFHEWLKGWYQSG